jgi:hypothetical protein
VLGLKVITQVSGNSPVLSEQRSESSAGLNVTTCLLTHSTAKIIFHRYIRIGEVLLYSHRVTSQQTAHLTVIASTTAEYLPSGMSPITYWLPSKHLALYSPIFQQYSSINHMKIIYWFISLRYEIFSLCSTGWDDDWDGLGRNRSSLVSSTIPPMAGGTEVNHQEPSVG